MTRKYLAFGLLAAAFVALALSQPSGQPTPAPLPPNYPITLAGKFQGPDAASDAAIVSALCDAIADAVEQDGMADQPMLATGVAIDALRRRSRELRCDGTSIGQKHPAVAEAVESYLNDALGVAGGPISSSKRADWVSAYRNIARAAEDAIR